MVGEVEESARLFLKSSGENIASILWANPTVAWLGVKVGQAIHQFTVQ